MATLRRLHRLAPALVTLVVCAGLASSGRGLARLLEAVGVASPEATKVEGQPSACASSLEWRDGTARAAPELTAVEPDADEDVPPWDTRDGAPLAIRFDARSRDVDHAGRGEVSLDTSTFDAGTRFPRGPPRGPRSVVS